MVTPEQVRALHIVTVVEFAMVDEPGAAALLGRGDSVVIAEGSDVMMYGDGGAGKTTLEIDGACHFAAGDPWLLIEVARPLKVLIVENEGPRAQFRKKLRRKLAAWDGSPIGDRLIVLEAPWGSITLAEESDRAALADAIRDYSADMVMLGPITRAGMNEAGTLQEVRDYSALLADVRSRAGRPVTFVLVHHENKGGTVSGAWEGAGDTLIHVQAQGHGRTRLYFQKCRWSSEHHGTTIQLAWTEGEGFAVTDEPVRDDNSIADDLLAAVLSQGGASWNTIERSVSGKGERKRAQRDRLLAGGRLIDAGGKGGMKLWHADDPAGPPSQDQLRPGRDAPGDAPASGPGETAGAATASLRPDVVRDAGRGDAPGSPDESELDRLDAIARSLAFSGEEPT